MAKSTISPWKRLFDLLKLDKSEVTQLYLYAIFAGLVSLSLPLGIQSVIQFIQSGQITTSWIVLVTLVILGVVLAGSLQIMQLRITETIQQRIFARYSFDFAFRFPRLDRQAIQGKIPSELMNRFFDIIQLQKGISKVLLDLSSALLQIVFSLLVLSFYHPFYIAFSISLIILLYFIFRPIIQKGFDTSLEESTHKYKTAHWLQEIARTDWSFRLTPTGNHSLQRLDEHTKNYLSSRENHFKVLWKQYMWMIAIKAIIVASLLGLGGYLVIDQQMNLGQFVAAEILILLILGAFEKIIQLLETVYDVLTSVEKLGQIQDLPMVFDETTTPIVVADQFPMEVLDPATPDHPILSVNRGDKLLLVCKDELAATNLLRVFIDGSCSDRLTPRWNKSIPRPEMLTGMFEQVGWFSKETHLFEGTLRENVMMGRSELQTADLEKALETVGLSSLIQQQVAGYDLPVSKGNKCLTASQRERLLVARALVHSPEILLLSFHGTALNNNELNSLLEAIEMHYPKATIVCTGPAFIDRNWKKIERNN